MLVKWNLWMSRQTNIQRECINFGSIKCQIHMFSLYHNSLLIMKHLGMKEGFIIGHRIAQDCIHNHNCKANFHHFPHRLICCIRVKLHKLKIPYNYFDLKLSQYSKYLLLLISYSKRKYLKLCCYIQSESFETLK